MAKIVAENLMILISVLLKFYFDDLKYLALL